VRFAATLRGFVNLVLQTFRRIGTIFSLEVLAMNVSLTKPEFEQFINEQVRSGHFSSPGEVIEAGLARLMLDAEFVPLDDADRAAIRESEVQITRGEDLDWKQVSASLRSKYLSQ
jgi:Arc/MetJ-type ribon-helix-helix transcriptional regulator